MKQNTPVERLYNGIIKENPTFVLVLGMCPTLAVTTAAINGIGMGLTTTVVLMMSNLFISLLRNVIPDKVRMPAYIVIVASFVTMVQLLLQGFIPSLYDALGIYIPLIVVNCIILGRAEAYASKNPPIPSLFDGMGMGLGFTLSITILAAFRELIGAGTVFGVQVMPKAYEPATIFILCLHFWQRFVQNYRIRNPKEKDTKSIAWKVLVLPVVINPVINSKGGKAQ